MKFSGKIIFLLIIFLAFVLRFFLLGRVPPSLDWDEASTAWSAYSIYKTGTDEYGLRFPVSIRSFNDYKPPLAVYLTVPTIAIFGISEWSERFPYALAGALTVVAAFFLTKELIMFGQASNKLRKLPYLVSFLLAVSPWHLQFNRFAHEVSIALFLFVLSLYFLAAFLRQKRNIYIFLYFVSIVLAFYTYHNVRLVIPLFFVGVGVYYRKLFMAKWRPVAIGLTIMVLACSPLVYNLVSYRTIVARAGEVSIFRDKKPALEYLAIFSSNYLSHYNFDFLFLNGDNIERHHVPDVGLLLLVEFPFLILGTYHLVKKKPSWGALLLIWMLVAPIPSALTFEAPHAGRSYAFLPAFQIVVAYGLLALFEKVRFRKIILSLVVAAFFAGNIFFFLHQYYVHMPLEYAAAWQFGYKELVFKVDKLARYYDKIYVSKTYDQPYIYFLFYGSTPSTVKNDGSFSDHFGKYYFYNFNSGENWDQEKHKKNTLWIWTPKDKLSKMQIIDKVYYPDGTVAFYIGNRL